MINKKIYPGVIWNTFAKKEIECLFPFGEIMQTKGTRYLLDDKRVYLVRLGKTSVIMPQMVYSKEAYEAFLHLYGEE